MTILLVDSNLEPGNAIERTFVNPLPANATEAEFKTAIATPKANKNGRPTASISRFIRRLSYISLQTYSQTKSGALRTATRYLPVGRHQFGAAPKFFRG